VRRSSRYEYARAIAERYRRAGKREKGRILDEFTAATGYHRKYALGLLLRPPPEPGLATRRTRARPTMYGTAEVALVRACWEVADQICSKRLAPYLGELLDQLARCDALPLEATPEVVGRVKRMSASSLDRALRPHRAGWPRRGLGTTKPGTLLKGQVPIKTFADWDGTVPGFLEIDLVAHCGSSGAGEFLLTLSTVDVATGWSACVGVANKGEYAVFEALERLRGELPFRLLGIDSDNGSEFLNHSLVRWCRQEGITFTRSRPYQKQDTCHVEQKNWSVVRRLAGYGRFERGALAALNRVHTLARDYVNFCQPVLKLLQKTRDGARVTKRYDQARTPYRQLLETAVLPPAAEAHLADRYAALHPIRLKLDLEAAQLALYAKAVRSDPSVRQR
jgi:integrase-like protein